MTTFVMPIIVLGMLILLHELGHFLVARSAGILCREFSIGFGPSIYTWESGETDFSLRLIPLGGYVLMAGEMGFDEEEDEEDSPFRPAEPGRNFTDKSVLTRMGVISAGPITNLLTALVLFFVIYSIVGIPVPTLQIGEIEPGYPAQEAGFQRGDEIVMIEGQSVDEWGDVVEIVQINPHQQLTFTVQRNQQHIDIDVVPREHPEREYGYIGMAPQTQSKRQPVGMAFANAFHWTGQVIFLLGATLWQMITGATGTDQLMGVVGMGAEIGRAAEMGLANLLSLTGSISASLGFLNLLPIPALDGSKLIFLGYEGITGHGIDPDKESFINMIGFALLIGLFLYVTFQDVMRLTG